MQSFGRGMPGIWGETARCEGRRIPAQEESAGAMGRSWEPRRGNDYIGVIYTGDAGDMSPPLFEMADFVPTTF